MTLGQLLFWGGAGLLGLTVILAVVFLIKKPKYVPSKAAYESSGETQRLRNGYPTDRLTIRRDEPTKHVPETIRLEEETVKLEKEEPEEGTILLQPEETVPLEKSGERSDLTEKL